MSAKNNNKKFSDLLFFRLHLVHSTSSPSFNSEKINNKKGKCRTSASFAENINNKHNNNIINVVSDSTVDINVTTDDIHRRSSNINVVDITNKIDHNNRSVSNNRENNNHQQRLALVAAENLAKTCDKNKNYFINHRRESGSEKENLSSNSSGGGNSDTSSGGSMRFVS